MLEMLLLIWLAASIFMTFIFCSAARKFVSEPDGIEDLDNTASEIHHKEYSDNTPYVL